MTALPTKTPVPVAPREGESDLARVAARRLAGVACQDRPVEVRLVDEGRPGESIVLPASSLRLLTDILVQMGQGNAVALLPVDAELSTQQAAELLNVSRPFLVKLLDERQIPCRKVGVHRRVLLRDVLAYKQRIDADRLKVLEELAAQAQELGMGY
jgi:excisionase family DNA binding protein